MCTFDGSNRMLCQSVNRRLPVGCARGGELIHGGFPLQTCKQAGSIANSSPTRKTAERVTRDARPVNRESPKNGTKQAAKGLFGLLEPVVEGITRAANRTDRIWLVAVV